LDLRLVYRKFA